MNKHNILDKKIKKQFLSINDSIESSFNKIKPLFFKIKKFKFDPNSKEFLIFGITIVLIITFFSIPSFFDKKIIQLKIKNQILNKYKIEIKFNEELNFGLLPKPHFITKNLSILENEDEIGKIGKFKVFIHNDNLFFSKNIEIKDILFSKAEFNLNAESIKSFNKLLFTDPSEYKITIKDSKIFYKNLAGDVLFISKIFESDFFYDYNKLENNFISKNEIFNLPFTFEIKENYFNKTLSSKINSKKIRLIIKNEVDYKEEQKKGVITVGLINENTEFNYKFDKNKLNFSSKDKDFYNGQIDFKPFYLSLNLNYKNLNFKNVLNNKKLLEEIIKSEIFINPNLNLNLNINVKEILNADQLNDLRLKIGILQGSINFADSKITWSDDLKITIKECYLNADEDQINFVGKLIFDYNDIDTFYSFYQVKKVNRKKIKQIEIDFVYDLSSNNFSFDNPKVDNEFNENLEKLVEKFNNKENRQFNKITFKNFINRFFSAYVG